VTRSVVVLALAILAMAMLLAAVALVDRPRTVLCDKFGPQLDGTIVTPPPDWIDVGPGCWQQP